MHTASCVVSFLSQYFLGIRWLPIFLLPRLALLRVRSGKIWLSIIEYRRKNRFLINIRSGFSLAHTLTLTCREGRKDLSRATLTQIHLLQTLCSSSLLRFQYFVFFQVLHSLLKISEDFIGVFFTAIVSLLKLLPICFILSVSVLYGFRSASKVFIYC